MYVCMYVYIYIYAFCAHWGKSACLARMITASACMCQCTFGRSVTAHVWHEWIQLRRACVNAFSVVRIWMHGCRSVRMHVWMLSWHDKPVIATIAAAVAAAAVAVTAAAATTAATATAPRLFWLETRRWGLYGRVVVAQGSGPPPYMAHRPETLVVAESHMVAEFHLKTNEFQQQNKRVQLNTMSFS